MCCQIAPESPAGKLYLWSTGAWGCLHPWGQECAQLTPSCATPSLHALFSGWDPITGTPWDTHPSEDLASGNLLLTLQGLNPEHSYLCKAELISTIFVFGILPVTILGKEARLPVTHSSSRSQTRARHLAPAESCWPPPHTCWFFRPRAGSVHTVSTWVRGCVVYFPWEYGSQPQPQSQAAFGTSQPLLGVLLGRAALPLFPSSCSVAGARLAGFFTVAWKQPPPASPPFWEGRLSGGCHFSLPPHSSSHPLPSPRVGGEPLMPDWGYPSVPQWFAWPPCYSNM